MNEEAEMPTANTAPAPAAGKRFPLQDHERDCVLHAISHLLTDATLTTRGRIVEYFRCVAASESTDRETLIWARRLSAADGGQAAGGV